MGTKRLLYERLGVAEYWVINVAERDLIAFAIANSRSGEIHASQVLSGLRSGSRKRGATALPNRG
ncbi:MAG: hypothetical protein AAF289_03440 [Cyanobacteria bacterium P01_A01_bin.135]